MSQAFVKEAEEEWPDNVMLTVNGLQVYLTRENNGIVVYGISKEMNKKPGKELHSMCNGLAY
ncbi:MAG: hypothetical protein ABJA37_11675 [Ferruginibacter sp.]